jgi:hypothetical protein
MFFLLYNISGKNNEREIYILRLWLSGRVSGRKIKVPGFVPQPSRQHFKK